MADKKSPQFVKALYEKNDFTDFLAVLEKKTTLQREYLLAGFATLTLLSLLVGYGTHFVTTLVAITYPCYQTVALIGKSRSDKQDVQWSTYWVIYAVFTLLECAADAIVKFFPFFYATKVVMLAWCMAPIEANGSNVLHQNVLKRFAGSSKSD